MVPEKKVAKQLVNVNKPRLPSCTSTDITIIPNGVNVDGISTAARPVMHTALADMNRESIYDIPLIVHRGSISRKDPTIMKNRKLSAIIMEGLVRLPGIIDKA